jgi:magnesium chelatase family protein
VLESLREPLESGIVAISRAARQLQYPARFQLVAAMNPCPCGYLGDPSGRCRCPPPEIARYRARISGPLLDRIDLRVEVPAVPSEDLLEVSHATGGSQGSALAAQEVLAARTRQQHRSGKLNSELQVSELQEVCTLERSCRVLLAQARVRLGLSARGVHRVLRVARTIADLERANLDPDKQTGPIGPVHLAEALQLRRATV